MRRWFYWKPSKPRNKMGSHSCKPERCGLASPTDSRFGTQWVWIAFWWGEGFHVVNAWALESFLKYLEHVRMMLPISLCHAGWPVLWILLYNEISFLPFRISTDGVDIVLDCLCGENTGKGLSLLKPLGTYILYGKWKKPDTYFKTKAFPSLKSLKIPCGTSLGAGGCHVMIFQFGHFQSRILLKPSMN